MSNATSSLVAYPLGSGGRTLHMITGAQIYAGTMVSQLAADGTVVPATTAASGPVIGVAAHDAASGAEVEILTDREFLFANGTAGNACSSATLVGWNVYCGDDHTIYDNSGGGTLPYAGVFMGMDASGKVRVLIEPGFIAAQTAATTITLDDAGNLFDTDNVEAALAQIVTDLAATTATHGANMIGFQDSANKTTAATVDTALDEIYTYLLAPRSIPLSLHSFRECDAGGDFANGAGNGGLLASDTTPILCGDAAESTVISWEAGNADLIATQIALPADFDDTKDVTIDCWISSGEVDAASLTIETGWNGGALVSDSLNDAATKSATPHKVTATVANGDIPVGAAYVTMILTPPAHAGDAIQLHGIRMNYTPKLA